MDEIEDDFEDEIEIDDDYDDEEEEWDGYPRSILDVNWSNFKADFF